MTFVAGRVSSGFSCAGDTDFTQTRHLDGWHGAGVRFIFGMDAAPNLVNIADNLAGKAWKPLRRDPKYNRQDGSS